MPFRQYRNAHNRNTMVPHYGPTPVLSLEWEIPISVKMIFIICKVNICHISLILPMFAPPYICHTYPCQIHQYRIQIPVSLFVFSGRYSGALTILEMGSVNKLVIAERDTSHVIQVISQTWVNLQQLKLCKCKRDTTLVHKQWSFVSFTHWCAIHQFVL